MKIDMSREAITRRLNTVAQLRNVCLSLANSGAGKKIREQFPENETVQRTTMALPVKDDKKSNSKNK